jgi:hypothetical protein
MFDRLPLEIQSLVFMFSAKPQDPILMKDLRSFVNVYNDIRPYDYWGSYSLRQYLCTYCNDFQRLTCGSPLTLRFNQILSRRRARTYNAIDFKDHYLSYGPIDCQIKMLLTLLTPDERDEFLKFVKN